MACSQRRTALPSQPSLNGDESPTKQAQQKAWLWTFVEVAERAELMAELDAAFFHLYGVDRDDAEYILSTFKGIHEQRTLFPDHCSTAEYILRKCAEMSFPG
jgi:hypothetical protein